MQTLNGKLLIIIIISINIFFLGCAKNINLDSNKFDPVEPFNRKIFLFNQISDNTIFKPAIRMYSENTPQFVKNVVNDFCSNIASISTIANNLIQFNLEEARNNSIVFLINSSIGQAGLFNISSKYGILPGKELSFSNTLVFYEYNTPFYFILPILGPSTMTNLITFIPDYFFNPQSILNNKYKKLLFWSILFNKKVQLLDKEVLVNMSSSSIDEYAFVRNAYLQYNKFNVYY